MSKLILMVGIPGSGKSTYIKKHANEYDTIVSRDAIRFNLLKENEPYFSREDEVFKLFIYEIVNSLKMGRTVWVDATHINSKSREKLLRSIEKYTTATSLEVIFVDVPLSVALLQNSFREGRARVPEDAIKRMYEQLEAPTYEEFANRGYETIAIYNSKER